MKKQEIDWPSIAQKSLTEYAGKIAIADALTRDPDMTNEDISQLDDEENNLPWKNTPKIMRLVLDSNIIFAAPLRDSNTRQLLFHPSFGPNSPENLGSQLVLSL